MARNCTQSVNETYSSAAEKKENFYVGGQSYSSKLTASDVTSATCKKSGSNYVVTLKVKGSSVSKAFSTILSQIIKEADGILIGASNGLSIAEGYNIFADDAWFQENMGDFREKYGLRCVLHGFSVPMKVEEQTAKYTPFFRLYVVGWAPSFLYTS